jgi:hypothetical protein
VAAGFVDFEITWQADVFSGAPQGSSAGAFGTQGINFRARKAANEEEWTAALADSSHPFSVKRISATNLPT